MCTLQIGNLELLCVAYNTMQQNALAVEKPLFATKMAAADAVLQKGLEVHPAAALRSFPVHVWVHNMLTACS